jgi:D-glycero-alpha-D-manno-heptose-7-phosphate kinase
VWVGSRIEKLVATDSGVGGFAWVDSFLTVIPFEVSAPTRIDFGGGWTDVPPFDADEGGFVCNVAISRFAKVRFQTLPDTQAEPELIVQRPGDRALLSAVARKYALTGAQISLVNDFPVAAGLGGSSAAGVAAIAGALRWIGKALTPAEIAEASRELEVLEMGIAGGRQDHYAAAFGGALGLQFQRAVTPNPIPLSAEMLQLLPRRCVVVYTGESRISANTITAVMGAYQTASSPVRGTLRAMRDSAKAMALALAASDIDALGALVGEQWTLQRSLHPAIPTPLIDRMIAVAMSNGAIGCKALGASGGGCVLMIAAAGREDELRTAVKDLGTEITFAVSTAGVSISG